MSWLELSVEIDQEAVESVSELFAQVGYNSGVAIEQPFVGSPDGPEYTIDAARPVVVRTYLPLDEHAEEARARVAQGLWALGMMRPVGELQVKQLEEEDWANAWKAHYPIRRIGERFVIVPSWLQYTSQAGDVVLNLDPGMAFGTGLHPTTQLCLLLLERYAVPGQRTLDLGCGSGILAIGAAKLGAQPVLAIDNDPIAVQATRENVERNAVGEVVTTVEGSLGPGAELGHWLGSDWATKQRRAHPTAGPVAFDPDAEFDLIVANILANVHVLLAPHLQRALKSGGTLVTSGIIADREADVADAFAAAGLAQIERLQEGDWVALTHRRP
ncbi:MAG: 50S ribosomal protein L11 methyltransferase [Chloroflexota bacterium]|nr:50S ribosomal protein L11 methyltransferase [Chloroflexota bacterium]